MSGTSTSKFTAATTVPNQESWGDYQRFNFSDTFPHVKLQAYSKFVPTSTNTSTISIETRNFRYAGFRLLQFSQSSDVNQFGSFYFQSFVADGAGINIFGFDGVNFDIYAPIDANSNKISNLSPGIAGTDAVNFNQLRAVVGAGTITLTGNVTGSGVLDIPFATTIVSTLNNIPVATGAININSQSIVSIGNLGVGVASPTFPLQFAQTINDCKIALYSSFSNSFQVYGFGVLGGILKYSVDSSASSHVFYCGSSATTSTELFRISGNARINVYNTLDMGSAKITSLATGVSSTDAANVGNITTAIAAIPSGTITLIGNVTGSGTTGTPFSTTIVSALNQIPVPTASVAMGGFKLTGLGTGTLGTDGVNLTQMNAAISSGVSSGTVTLIGNVTGSGTVGSSFSTTLALRLNQILTPNSDVAMGGFKITGLATGTAGADGVNLTQMNSAISAGTITLTGNVTGTGTVGTPFATTIVSTLNNIPLATGTVNLNSQNLGSVGNLGLGVASPLYPLQFASALGDCKICLYPGAANNFQVYGFGVLGGILKYSVDNSSSSHVFYCGASTTTSTELFKISGTGYATVLGGTGTIYSRVPSATWFKTGGSSATVAAANTWIKAVMTSSLNPPNRQFTTSTNRITFTGSDLAANCVGMFSATAVLSPSSGTPKLGLAVYLNGTAALGCQAYASPTTVGGLYTLSISSTMCALNPADFLEIWVLSSTATTITVSEMSLSFKAC